MTVLRDGDRIVLEGDCHVEEAEPLLGLLATTPVVDWSRCLHIHGAVLQVLLSCGAKVVGVPADPFLATWIAPALAPEE
ncbi:MAG: hypothetical protein ABIO39_10005 [Caulobacteraceae bacterium]